MRAQKVMNTKIGDSRDDTKAGQAAARTLKTDDEAVHGSVLAAGTKRDQSADAVDRRAISQRCTGCIHFVQKFGRAFQKSLARRASKDDFFVFSPKKKKKKM
jgi:hypothetical protein